MVCGCSGSGEVLITDMATGQHTHLGEPSGHTHPPGSFEPHSHLMSGHLHSDHFHHHEHDHGDEHHPTGPGHEQPPDGASFSSAGPAPARSRTIHLETEILQRNQQRAERNRGWFEGRGILAVNLMSAPGAGKTTLLERTIRELDHELRIHVIEGDQATLRDAERIHALNTPVIQINTGAACHLDAEMVAVAVRKLDPPPHSTVLIENVGNLVCPALFDLGERVRVVIASVTDGDDKPAKYPHMFRAAHLVVLNKIDLLPHVQFDPAKFIELARQRAPEAAVLQVSAMRGDGLADWYDYLRRLQASSAV